MRANLLLGAGAYLLAFCGRGLWDPDEPRFAQVAREMLSNGDWIVPHFDGRPLPLLPPLTYWASAAASWPIGDVTAWAARLPVVVFAVVAIAATMIVSDRAGAWAGLVLLSSAKFLHQGQYLQSDMILVGSQTWALAAFYRAYTAEARRDVWLVSAYLAVALGVLTKGPIGAVLPAAIFGLFLIWQRDLRSLRRMGLLWGIPLVAILVLPWYAAACACGGEAFCRELILKHNFGMFFNTWSHSRPFYYYLVQLPWMFLPWTLLAPAVLRRVTLDRETRFLLIWIVFCFVFFSASEAKQAKYLLPILSPLSVLVARWLREADTTRAVRIAASMLAAVLLGAAVAAWILLPARWPTLLPGAVAVASSGTLLAVSAAVLAKRRKLAPGLLASCLLVPALVARFTLVPALEFYKSPRVLTEAANQLGHPLAIHGISYRQTGGLIYYTGRLLPVLELREELDSFMGVEEPRLAYIARKVWRGAYPVVSESPYRGGTYLVTNQRGEKP